MSIERKCLRKSRLGVPDVYPQDARQKEDDLCGLHLKQGFSVSSVPLLTDEYGSGCSKATSAASGMNLDLKLISKRKKELSGAFSADHTGSSSSSSSSNGLKRQPLNTKDNFTLVTAKTARKADIWFKDLSSGLKSLSSLSKKVPILNKREDILSSLIGVPVRRAAWLIKMTAAYHTAMSETNKTKKRTFLPDPGSEWTSAITKFMKEQLNELNSESGGSDLTAKQWNYACELSEFMYGEGLLDRQEFLQWIIDQFEKIRYPDEPNFNLILPLALQYMHEWSKSAILSRKLAFQSAKKISHLLNESEALSSAKDPPSLTSALIELLNDPSTRFAVLSLSTILQVIVLECPTALVWNYYYMMGLSESKGPSSNYGSPLDLLPGIWPSNLPLGPNPNNSNMRQLLRQAEGLIKERSIAAELKWSTGERSHSRTSQNVTTVLSILEDLDSYCFEKMDSASNTLESLYSRLFRSNNNDSSPEQQDHHRSADEQEEAIIVHTLCTWAVTSKRSGDHRAFVVAKLLEHRQSEILYKESEEIPQDESLEQLRSDQQDNNYIFQSQLLYYLDTDSPTLISNKQEFSNLVLLFYELIAHDVFSHDQYLCSLISRGDLDAASSNNTEEDGEDRKINDDITNIVNEIKVGNQLSENKDTVDIDASLYSRHWQYTYHFPLPMDESYAHDANQRFVLLYGAGSNRGGGGKDESISSLRSCKRLSKEILKLFSKKHSIDIAHDKVITKKKSDFIFDTVSTKFQNLSYYDQHSISHLCGNAVVEMLSVFHHLNGSYLPVPEHVLFLFDLAGLALNIQGLIDWSLLILKELPGVESILVEKSSHLARIYTSTMALYIVGVLRRYHSIFILNSSDAVNAFDQLVKIVFGGKNDYNSAEWCILAYLYDLSCNYSLFKNREKFSDLKRLFSTSTDPSEATYSLTDRRFGIEYISNPKKKFDFALVKALESPKNQYNFVCNVFIDVCECNDTDKINDLAIFCCELTSQINALSAEWLGALTALCNAGASNVYADLLHAVNIRDSAIYNRLGIFISILIARSCFQLQSFVISVVIPSLLKAWDDVKDNSPSRNESEIGARVSCHLLLRLFKSIEPFSPPLFYTRPHHHASGIRCSSDRHLLGAAHRNITVGAIIAVLKAIMVLGDANSSNESFVDFGGLGINSPGTSSLSDFAKYTLRLICQQQWVYDRCLQVPDDLLRNGTLLDPMLSSKQAQTLLRLICSGNGELMSNRKTTSSIHHILNTLDEWNLRVSIVDIKLTYHQLSALGSSDLSDWLDQLSHAIVDSFQLHDQSATKKDDGTDDVGPPEAKKAKLTDIPRGGKQNNVKYSYVWMIPSLVRHLKFLQNRVLKVAVEYLEVSPRGRLFPSKGPQKGYMPFLGLILTCIRELDSESKDKKDRIDREELKDNLLSSLHNQLSAFLSIAKGGKNVVVISEDEESRKRMQDALMLRFCLVGGLFDSIMSSTNSVNDWSLLLAQLIARGVVDLSNNADVFTNILDMLAVLIHSSMTHDRSDSNLNDKTNEESTRKHNMYLSLVKKLRREIGDKNSLSIGYLRQLLPLPKVYQEALISEPFGFVSDSKGNKIKGLNSDKKIGLQVFDKAKISPWEILEGHKNPAPLSWSWFAAMKHERKVLKYLEAFQELKYANSSGIDKSFDYFTEAPPLPIENLEPSPKELLKEMMIGPNTANAEEKQGVVGSSSGGVETGSSSSGLTGRSVMMGLDSNNMIPTSSIPLHHHSNPVSINPNQGYPHPMNNNSSSMMINNPMMNNLRGNQFVQPSSQQHMNNHPHPAGHMMSNNPSNMMFNQASYQQGQFQPPNVPSSFPNSSYNAGNAMNSQMRLPMASHHPRQMMGNSNNSTGSHQVLMQQQRVAGMRPRHPGIMVQNRPSGNNYHQSNWASNSNNSNSFGGHVYGGNSNSNNGGNFAPNSNPGNRYQGKQALQNMLRAKHPGPPTFMPSSYHSGGQFRASGPPTNGPNNVPTSNSSSSMYNPSSSSSSNSGGSGNNANFNQNANYPTGSNFNQQYLMSRNSANAANPASNNSYQQSSQMLRRPPLTSSTAGGTYNRNPYGNMGPQGNYRPNNMAGQQLMGHVQPQATQQMGFPSQQQSQNNMF